MRGCSSALSVNVSMGCVVASLMDLFAAMHCLVLHAECGQGGGALAFFPFPVRGLLCAFV